MHIIKQAADTVIRNVSSFCRQCKYCLVETINDSQLEQYWKCEKLSAVYINRLISFDCSAVFYMLLSLVSLLLLSLLTIKTNITSYYCYNHLFLLFITVIFAISTVIHAKVVFGIMKIRTKRLNSLFCIKQNRPKKIINFTFFLKIDKCEY